MKRSTIRGFGRFLPESFRNLAKEHFLRQSNNGVTAQITIVARQKKERTAVR